MRLQFFSSLCPMVPVVSQPIGWIVERRSSIAAYIGHYRLRVYGEMPVLAFSAAASGRRSVVELPYQRPQSAIRTRQPAFRVFRYSIGGDAFVFSLDHRNLDVSYRFYHNSMSNALSTSSNPIAGSTFITLSLGMQASMSFTWSSMTT